MVISFLLWVVIFLVTVTVHEYAHGIVAYWCGDRTAQRMGRLSLNPFRHIDPFWTVILPVALMMMGAPPIGMAKPVPVNFAALKHRKRDIILVSLAGAVANLLFAWVLSIIMKWFSFALLLIPIYINIGLAIFNLLPLPPLDGSRVLAVLLPDHIAYQYGKIERYGFLILMALLWMGMIDGILFPLMNMVCFLMNIPGVR